MTRLDFTLQATAPGSRARAARFRTLHNEVLTPMFMPVGTHAAVRAQSREDLLASGAQVLLANTYHLLLRPGVEIFEKFGGIHRFMNWPRSVLTDSGGFQIFSLPGSRTLREECAEFKSYVDRTTIHLSPERSIATQKAIGADIMMVLDQCVPSTVERGIAKDAMELTHRWALRSLAARGDSPQALFGIVQGAGYDGPARRKRARDQLKCPSTALLSAVSRSARARRSARTAPRWSRSICREDRPRYLMGVGTTRDLLEAVHRGVDMFDCILPTALAKQGVAFTSVGRRDLRRAAYRGMEGPIDPACDCYTCRTYSIAYLFHLHRVRETMGWQLLGLHNIHFYMQLMRRMRGAHPRGHLACFLPSAARCARRARQLRAGFEARHQGGTALRKMQLGRYEVVVREGVGHIRDRHSGEVMHSVNDPAQEARSLYVEQSRLIERLQRRTSLRSWCGTSAWAPAANAMAAIHAVEALRDRRPARAACTLVSFENDFDALHARAASPAMVQAPAACGAAGAVGATIAGAAAKPGSTGCCCAAISPSANSRRRRPTSFSSIPFPSRPIARCGRWPRFANSPPFATRRWNSIPTPTRRACAPPCWRPASMSPRASARARKPKRPLRSRRVPPLRCMT